MNVPMGKFKAAMSRYIHAAHAGKDVVVTSRGKALVRLVPVAEEQPIAAPGDAERDKRLAELRAKLKAAMPGVRIGKGRFSLGSFQPVKLKPGTKTMSETVIEDRR
jgi:prevent-host-death family protein